MALPSSLWKALCGFIGDTYGIRHKILALWQCVRRSPKSGGEAGVVAIFTGQFSRVRTADHIRRRHEDARLHICERHRGSPPASDGMPPATMTPTTYLAAWRYPTSRYSTRYAPPVTHQCSPNTPPCAPVRPTPYASPPRKRGKKLGWQPVVSLDDGIPAGRRLPPQRQTARSHSDTRRQRFHSGGKPFRHSCESRDRNPVLQCRTNCI